MSNFGLTIQIPAFKKVKIGETYKAYKTFMAFQQKAYITELLQDSIDLYKPPLLEYLIFFEEHADKRIHAHIYMKQIDITDMKRLQEYFCNTMGIKKEKQMNEIFHYDTLLTTRSCERWLEYCKKNQNI